MTPTRDVSLAVWAVLLLPLIVAEPGTAQPADASPPKPTMASVLEASSPADWQALDPSNTLHLRLAGGGEVVIRLAPEFAPAHVANIKALVAERYFDGLAVTRSQENYVVQWGDPAAEGEERRPIENAKPALAPEFEREPGDLRLALLDDPDAYAHQTGFALGFPIYRDPLRNRVGLAHCNSMVGAGRGMEADSGSGAELYAVIGHAPRHLDRNVTLVGRVVRGMEHLSTLPRGTGNLGFYEDPAQHVPIESIRLGSELPEAERAHLELLRTDTATFKALVEARRTRAESWFIEPTGRIEVCNVPLPVRPAGKKP